MRVLLDTHALLWWFFDDPKLSGLARDLIKNPDNTIIVSGASAWEISTKFRLGKLPEASDVVDRFSELLVYSNMTALPITIDHALLAGAFKVKHRDPFDRMLAAQSRIEDIPLLTIDRALAEFGIEIVWQ